MTSPYLIPDIKAQEGLDLHAYPDPLSHAEPYTVGYGATGPGINRYTVWTLEQAETDLARRVDALIAQLAKALPWFTGLSDLRQDVLTDMAYNLGFAGLLGFHRMLTHAEDGQYALAAVDMLGSLWAKQVPGRAIILARQMRTDEHAGVTILPNMPLATPAPSVPTSASFPPEHPTGAAVHSPSAAAPPEGPMSSTPVDFSPGPIQLPSQARAFIQQLGTHLGALAGGALASWGAIQPGQETQLAAIAGGIAVWGVSLLINYIAQHLRHQQAQTAVAAALATPAPKAPA